jgi:hypothetical protein
MRIASLALLLAVFAALGRAAEPVAPFEDDDPASRSFTVKNPVDAAVLAGLKKHGIAPAHRCSDAVFVRRVYLDTTGTLPEPEAVEAFLADRRPDKRARLVDALLDRPEFADYQALLWCDVLRVKAEFPINLWPNAVQAYHRFIRDALRENRPYDEFARELLTASGSNFRVPAVNFWRAVQGRDPEALAKAVALTFMGSRIETWPAERRAGLAAFFSRVAYKRTLEWKEEIVYPDPSATEPVAAVFPDGTKARIAPDEDPRRVFADWLVSPRNDAFNRAIANRIWCRLMGRGVVHEPDDFRPDNPPSNPRLLDALARSLVESGYDLRALYRLVLGSRTYQQSPIPQSDGPEAEALFAHYVVRPLDAEVLIDALCRITGTHEEYMSAIPEPFTFVPEEERTIDLADGSISSPFLEMFGRPARDTGLWSERNRHPTAGQRLHLLNSRDVQARLTRGPRLLGRLAGARGQPRRAIRILYVTILSRPPTPEEIAAIEGHLRANRADPRRAAVDLAWALINSKEFLYRH